MLASAYYLWQGFLRSSYAENGRWIALRQETPFWAASIMAEDKSVVTVLADSRFRCGSLRKIPLTASVATPRTIATKAPLRPLAALLVRIV